MLLLNRHRRRRCTVNKCVVYYNSTLKDGKDEYLEAFDGSFKTSVIETVCLTFLKLNTGFIEEFKVSMDEIYNRTNKELFDNLMIAYFQRTDDLEFIINEVSDDNKYSNAIEKFVNLSFDNMYYNRNIGVKSNGNVIYNLFNKYKSQLIEYFRINEDDFDKYVVEKLSVNRRSYKIGGYVKSVKQMKINVFSDGLKHNIEFADYINNIYNRKTKIISLDSNDENYFLKVLSPENRNWNVIITDSTDNRFEFTTFININTPYRYLKVKNVIKSNSSFFKKYFAESLATRKEANEMVKIELDNNYNVYIDIVERYMINKISSKNKPKVITISTNNKINDNNDGFILYSRR